MDMTVYLMSFLIGIEGLMNLFGIYAPLQKQGLDKYTDESIKAWLRPNGLYSILMAVGLAGFDAAMWANIGGTPLLIGGIVVCVIGIIGTLVNWKKNLVVANH
ncbi:MAG: hypothetical protein RR945_07390 [Erysipelotrichaceae bacterium]